MKPTGETEAIIALELALLDPVTRRDPAFLGRHIADDFEEIAASGRRFGKDEVLARLPLENGIGFGADGFQCRWLNDDLALLHYQARRSADGMEARSIRSSLWRREHDIWRMCFHQGTPLAHD